MALVGTDSIFSKLFRSSSKKSLDNDIKEGLVWTATILPDACFDDQDKLIKGLPKKLFDLESQKLKSRHYKLPIHVSEFLENLTAVPKLPAKKLPQDAGLEFENGMVKQGPLRYMFDGNLNGWPALKSLEVVKIEKQVYHQQQNKKREVWTTVWISSDTNHQDMSPCDVILGNNNVSSTNPKNLKIISTPNSRKVASQDSIAPVYRVTLRSPAWTNRGWSPSSAAHCFWHQPINSETTPAEQLANTKVFKNFVYGSNMVNNLKHENAVATHIHVASFRFAKVKEAAFERLFCYHSTCLVEWDHKEYTTVVEIMQSNILSSGVGKLLWDFSKNDTESVPVTDDMSSFLFAPLRPDRCEINCFDIPIKSLAEYKAYLRSNTGPKKLFLNPRVILSHPINATVPVTRRDIAQYLINYNSWNNTYDLIKHNCQTFVFDFCALLTENDKSKAKVTKQLKKQSTIFVRRNYKNAQSDFLKHKRNSLLISASRRLSLVRGSIYSVDKQ